MQAMLAEQNRRHQEMLRLQQENFQAQLENQEKSPDL